MNSTSDITGSSSCAELEALLERASGGDKTALQRFYGTLLESKLFVPERFQSTQLSDTPKYPDEFLNLLAVQSSSHVVVPVFSLPEHIAEWSGNELSFRTLGFTELLAILPSEWWLVLNPGLEVEKEFSPWEIEKLKLGRESIDEVVEDLLLEEMPINFEVAPLEPDQEPQLKQAILSILENDQGVLAAHLILERAQGLEGEKIERFVLSVVCDGADSKSLIELRQNLKRSCDAVLIGANPIRIITSTANDLDPIAALCAKLPALYQRRTGLLARLGALFR